MIVNGFLLMVGAVAAYALLQLLAFVWLFRQFVKEEQNSK